MTEETLSDRVHARVIALVDQRKYAEVVKAARVLLAPDRSDAEQADGLSIDAYIFGMQKQYHQALDYQKQAIAKNPNDRGIEHALMGDLIDCGYYAEAIESADRLIALDRGSERRPFTDSAHFHKAYALYKLGRLDEAEQEFAQVEDEGNSWIDGRLVTKSSLLAEIARARDLKR